MSPSLLRRALVAFGAVLALVLGATSTSTSATTSASDVRAAKDAADAAEREAERAVEAIETAKGRIQPALETAQGTRTRHDQVKKQTTRQVARVASHQKKVTKANRKLKKATQKLAKANKKAKKKAKKARAKALTARNKARKQLKKQRSDLAAQRAVLSAARTANADAWDAWRQAKTDHEDSIRYADQAAVRSDELREVSDELIARTTTVTRLEARLLPAVRQASASPAAADAATHVVTVEAEPAVRLLDVAVERLVEGTWVEVAEGRTRADGRVDVAVTAAGTYRAVVNGHVSAPATDEWSLSWSDEFDTSTLSDAWTHRMTDHNPEGMRECSRGDASAATMSGQTLQLWVKRDTAQRGTCAPSYDGVRTPGHSYRLNGHVGTQRSFSFTYGVAAARMKFQDAQEGQHAAFWLQPASYAQGGFGPDFTGAEIDVVEFNGYVPHVGVGRLFHTVYADDADGVLQQVTSGFYDDRINDYLADKDDKWFNRYHVFSVEWSPEGYVFRIDGVETWRTDRNVSSRPQFLVLSLLSSDYEIVRAGAEGEKTLGTQKMDVDWVRVWQ